MRHPQAGGRHILLLMMLAILTLAICAGAAAPAGATPLDPTMSTTRLLELLAASPTGTVDGYFKTVVKGATVVNIPCTLKGILPQAAIDNGDLILFEATGTVIDDIGGIAAGMSGSPIYANDGGTDKLVGAVSYGMYFANGGLGLATPIEHMMEIEDDFTIDPLAATAARTVRLDEPVVVGDRRVDRVVVAPTSRAARVYRDAGARTVVLRSLASLQVGGIAPASPVFREFRDRLAAEGVELRAGLAGGAAGMKADFSTPLVPGASVGELLMRGDYWYGGVGTVTYLTAGDQLVAFGHPMLWDGATSAYMTNADVIDVWGTLDEPFKVVAPGAVRGAITVDSGAGIAGQVGAIPADVPFSCTATNTATGKIVSTTTYATPWAADQAKWPYYQLKALSFYPALYRATGDGMYDGHITYTLTMELSDGVDTYTVTRHNTWEDSYGFDAPFLAVVELMVMMQTLTNDPDGTIDPHLTSVDLDVDLSPDLDRARIVGVDVPGGVKTGLNTVKVTMYEYGDVDPVTVDVPLTIPEGVATTGTVYAKAPFTNIESMGDGWYGWWTAYGPNTAPPQTLAGLVDDLNGAMGNDMLLVAYDPPGGASNEDDWGFGEPWGDDAMVATLPMEKYLTGAAQKEQVAISLYTPGLALTGRPFPVMGYVSSEGSFEGQTMKIYTREAGALTDTLVAELPIETITYPDGGYETTFRGMVPGMKYNGTLTAAWEGDDTYLYSWAATDVLVKAKVALGAEIGASGVQLSATVSPKQTGGKVFFQRKKGSRWVDLKRVSLGATGKAAFTWDVAPGRYVIRAVFPGSELNYRGVSKPVTVNVK